MSRIHDATPSSPPAADDALSARGYQALAALAELTGAGEASTLATAISYADDQPEGRGTFARAAVALARTGASAAAEDVVETMGGPSGAASAAISFADALFDVDDAPKVFTAFAADAHPAAPLTGGAVALVDAAAVAWSAVSRRDGTALRGGETLAENLRDGTYGPVGQTVAHATDLLAGDAGAVSSLTSSAAATGERGVWAAWGNAAGDAWADLADGPANDPGRFVPVDEVEARAQAAWYAPWDW